MGFESEMTRAINGTMETLERTRILLIQKLFRDIVFDTPVLDGTLRGSWKTTKQNPSSEKGSSDPSGALTVSQMEVTVGASTFGVDIYLTNNQPYAYRIEFLGWSSVKAPQGMVRRNVLRVQEILKQVQTQVNRGR